MKERIVMKGKSLLEMLKHTPSSIARAAQRTGNASGAHKKDKSKVNRREARKQERRARDGDYD